MEAVLEVIKIIAGVSSDKLTLLISLSSIALAAFAIYVVHQKDKG